MTSFALTREEHSAFQAIGINGIEQYFLQNYPSWIYQPSFSWFVSGCYPHETHIHFEFPDNESDPAFNELVVETIKALLAGYNIAKEAK